MASEPADSPLARARADSAQWAQARERGSATLVALGVFLALRIGRPLTRLGLHLIAAYFASSLRPPRGTARDCTCARALGREPSAADRYRQVLRLCQHHSRSGCVSAPEGGVTGSSRSRRVEGDALMLDSRWRAAPRGCFSWAAHLGGFALVSSVGGRRAGMKVAMAMYDAQAGLLMSVFNTIHAPTRPTRSSRSRASGGVMLRIRDCLEEGKFVGMLADHATIGDVPAHIVSFLGAPALFPFGPMHASRPLCGARSLPSWTGLYAAATAITRYFARIADFSQPLPAGTRGGGARGHRTLCAAPGRVLPLGPLQLVQLLRLLARRSSAG